MFRFPYFGYPYNYPYYRYQYVQPKTNKEEEKKNSITNSNEISNTINSRSFSETDQAIFEIFGIKLYLDDLIILGLLFFLYQQNVNDEMLYMILLLLLFS